MPPNKNIIRKFLKKWNPRIGKPITRNVKITPTVIKTFYRVNVSNSLNVRSSKSIVAKNIMGHLNKGQIIEVKLIDKNGWALVILPSGKSGFVRSSYLIKN